ncbi:MAG: peroxiredoxin family protein [Nodosilinea sp.]
MHPSSPIFKPTSYWRHLLPRPAALGLPLGAIAPDFALWDVTHHRTLRLANWRGKQPVVLAFTRIFAAGVYCPFCYPHIIAMNQAYAQFRQIGAEVLMLTGVNRREAQAVVEDLHLSLPLLIDETGHSFSHYFTGQALGAPLPAQFVLDVQGRLRYAHLFSFLHHNAAPETLLATLETL